MVLYCEVAPALPIRKTFHYRVPAELDPRLRPGMRVEVPFGAATLRAFCVGRPRRADVPDERLRDVARILDPEPLADAELLELTQWMARHYLASWGQALARAIPAGVKASRAARTVAWVRATGSPDEIGRTLASDGTLTDRRRRILELLRDAGGAMRQRELLSRAGCGPVPVRGLAARGLVRLTWEEAQIEWLEDPGDPEEEPKTLTPDQARAWAEIQAAVEPPRFAVFLIRGVTGSGKTELYLRAAERAIAAGRQALLLVPEIALTAQMVGRVRARFPRTAVLHSQMSDAERARAWKDARAGAVDLVVGARSAVFTPMRALGAIAIDEEHESSYKEASTPRYHAREVALWRARRQGVPLLLGSATPSMESYHRARTGEFRLVWLPTRIGERPLPKVEVVDLVSDPEARFRPSLLSIRLRRALEETLKAGRQAILFLNRRGYSRSLVCGRCGWTLRCPFCEAVLTYHRQYGRALCHYCLRGAQVPELCPDCKVGKPRQWGAGTERVQHDLQRLYPGLTTIRMDSDTMTTRAKLREALAAFGEGRAQVLIGTKMVAKGLHFPRVTLVGVINADTAFAIPDFRAAEVTFQELTQVAGRPGRGEDPGRVFVQTMNANHYAVTCAVRHDFEAFYEREVALRRELGYPPFGALFRLLFEGPVEKQVVQVADELTAQLRRELPEGAAEVLGPGPAPVGRVRSRFRHHALVKARDEAPARAALERVFGGYRVKGRVEVSVDVDPYGMA